MKWHFQFAHCLIYFLMIFHTIIKLYALFDINLAVYFLFLFFFFLNKHWQFPLPSFSLWLYSENRKKNQIKLFDIKIIYTTALNHSYLFNRINNKEIKRENIFSSFAFGWFYKHAKNVFAANLTMKLTFIQQKKKKYLVFHSKVYTFFNIVRIQTKGLKELEQNLDAHAFTKQINTMGEIINVWNLWANCI